MMVSMETARICQVQNNNSAICISVCLKMKVNHLGMTLVMFVFLRGSSNDINFSTGQLVPNQRSEIFTPKCRDF